MEYYILIYKPYYMVMVIRKADYDTEMLKI
jgi:hypothetical protein